MIPKTDDGRVLFAVPWHNKIVLGTTDTPVETVTDEPVPMQQEIEFILKHIGRYLTKDPQLSDVKSMFAGLRPLVKGKSKITSALSRDHQISISESEMITITGGKWTTYRKMAEDTVNLAAEKMRSQITSVTKDLKLEAPATVIPAEITTLTNEELKKIIKEAVQKEMCMTVEDFLSRRTRQLLLDATAAINMAPVVANQMAAEMNKDEKWVQQQITNFNEIAKNYIPQ